MKPDATRSAALAAYAAFYEGLSPADLQRLEQVVTPDVHFRDPFNDFVGLAPLRGVYERMFERLREPRFVILDQALGSEAGYLRWDFTFQTRRRDWLIVGISEVRFAEDGRVCEHLDHWDAASQLYEHVPLLGSLLSIAKKRAA